MAQRVAGIIQFKTAGETQNAKGAFSYNPGKPKREAVLGSDGFHGYKETPQVAFIEGAITDRGTLDLAAFVTLKDISVTIELANGKVFILRDAFYAGDGTVDTDEAEIEVRFEGAAGEEVA